MIHTNVHHSKLDRNALPNADRFFRDHVERYRRTGSKARGKCPFHQPSSHHGKHFSLPFAMDLDKGLFYCFNCGVGGDIIRFVMLRDGIDFLAAAKELGVLQPLDRQQAEEFRREKQAREAKQQAKADAYEMELKHLLWAMETAEWIHDFAWRHHDDELYDLAERRIVEIGADFVLLKARVTA